MTGRCEKMKKIVSLIFAVFLTVGLTSCEMTKSSDSTKDTTTTTVIQSNDSKSVENQITYSTEKETTTTTQQTTAAPAVKENYESNSNFDIVEKVTYKDELGYTHIIHKVKAKNDVSVAATVIAYDANNNVIGKSEDNITLTAGQFNFFNYSFEVDISNAKLTVQTEARTDSFMDGPRNAVEMVTSNKVDDNLFITFKQVTDKLGSLAKFKILFYKGGKIVDFEDNNYFNIYAKNMKGKGQTDVATVWVYGKDYDKFECYFEP